MEGSGLPASATMNSLHTRPRDTSLAASTPSPKASERRSSGRPDVLPTLLILARFYIRYMLEVGPSPVVDAMFDAPFHQQTAASVGGTGTVSPSSTHTSIAIGQSAPTKPTDSHSQHSDEYSQGAVEISEEKKSPADNHSRHSASHSGSQLSIARQLVFALINFIVDSRPQSRDHDAHLLALQLLVAFVSPADYVCIDLVLLFVRLVFSFSFI